MEKRNQRVLIAAVMMFISFVVWTLLVCTFDIKPIGPRESLVGVATLNGSFHKLTGVNMALYTVTDWLGLVPVAVALGFASLGLFQWIRRKSFKKVDFTLFVLGGFYVITFAAYLLFEMYPLNFRPVLIDGVLEASYPSSTTLLVCCIMPAAIIQLEKRVKRKKIKVCLNAIIVVFCGFMVTARLISGVHWLSDIIGGMLLSASLVAAYYYVSNIKR